MKMLKIVLGFLFCFVSQLNASNFEFDVQTTTEPHAYGSVLTLQNSSGTAAKSFRILWIHQIDPEKDCVPGNVMERVLSFPYDDSKVALPVTHFRFSFVVYQGEFPDEVNDRDAVSSGKSVFEYHGDAVYQFCEKAMQEVTSVKQIHLTLMSGGFEEEEEDKGDYD